MELARIGRSGNTGVSSMSGAGDLMKLFFSGQSIFDEVENPFGHSGNFKILICQTFKVMHLC